MKRFVLIGAVAAVLAGCASAPQRSEQVEQARTAIDRLGQEPLAQQAAGKDLEAARKALQDAETAMKDKQAPGVVDHYAYVARRHAEAGEARVSEARSRQEVAGAQEQRSNVLVDARAREAQEARAQLANAQQQLADLQAKQTDRGTVVTLGDVLFDTGQATLKPGADLAINRLATYLSTNGQTKALIEGHTDSRGSDEYNEALSDRRARAVATALASRGIPADQVQTVGRGKSFPVASNDTPEGRQQNRRVEIVLSDSSGRFAEGRDRPVQR